MRERALWLAWSQVSGIGPVLLRRIVEHFGSLTTAWEASLQDLGVIEGIGPQLLTQIAAVRSHLKPDTFLAEHEQANPEFWTPADEDYPALLTEIPSPPPVLYYRGAAQLPELRGTTSAIGIVGTRDPSEYGRRWTRKLSQTLAQQGFIIVSGLAEGIDGEAHSACLEAGGRTIAVLGTGVDVVYPRRHQALYGQIVQQGWVCSEYPSGTQPDRSHFPRRNRIIAGLCRAVLVMEAPSQSGALITAHVANDFGRDVYVLPGSLDNPRAIGCLGLINRGAQVILNEGHLLELLGNLPQLDQSDRPQPSAPFSTTETPPLDPPLTQILEAIAQEPTSFDAIVQQTALSTGTVSSALLQLELLGLVAQLPGLRYQRI
jgi:DNA processing protein